MDYTMVLMSLIAVWVPVAGFFAFILLYEHFAEKRRIKAETERLLKSIEAELIGIRVEVKELRRRQGSLWSRG